MAIKWQDAVQDNLTDNSIHFLGDPEGESTLICRIGHETLDDFFRAGPTDLTSHLTIFKNNSAMIRKLAERRYAESHERNKDGGVDIDKNWLDSIGFKPWSGPS